MKKMIIMVIVLLITGIGNGADDFSVSESVFPESPYCVGSKFYDASKQTIYQGGDKNDDAFEATIKRYELISATYIGLLSNSLQILLEEVAYFNATNNNTSQIMPNLSGSESNKRILFIPLNLNKEGLLRVVKDFSVSKIIDGNSVLQMDQRARFQKDLLLTIVNEFGCFEKAEYKEKPKKEGF